jgi:hypothetical protein
MSGGDRARATFSVVTLSQTLCGIPAIEFWTYYPHPLEVNSFNQARNRRASLTASAGVPPACHWVKNAVILRV